MCMVNARAGCQVGFGPLFGFHSDNCRTFRHFLPLVPKIPLKQGKTALSAFLLDAHRVSLRSLSDCLGFSPPTPHCHGLCTTCSGPESSPLNEVVSEAFVRFFVEIVGHYSLFLTSGEERSLQREAFRKAVSSKSLRRFLEVFMETQTFRGFIQERELRRQGAKG